MAARWTKEEEDYLIENYGKLGALECSVYLNRTRKSVFAKGSKLGLKARGKLRTHEDYLKELATLNSKFTPIEPYIKSDIAIRHMCPNGHEVKLAPASVVFGNAGCRTCYTSSQSKTPEQYSNSVPFEVLDEYVNSYTKLRHKCTCGFVWEALPDTINKGGKCPKCSPNKGFDPTKPAILYYVKITNRNLIYYKIGITNSSIDKRFSKDKNTGTKIELIMENSYLIGAEAREEEQRILKEYSEFRQNIPELLVSGGNTELFEFDVLGLDK